MAPTVLQSVPAHTDFVKKSKTSSQRLENSGSLDQFKHFDSTPAIGREFPDVQLADLINASNADTLIRDLAITSTSFIVSY